MKQTTKLFGIISSLLILVGVIFKTQHWPGAGVILMLGIVAFAAIYAILLFIDRQKSLKSSIAKTSNLFVLLAMVLISVGFLFKMQHWPGAGVIIYVSNVALLALIPIKYLQAAKEKDKVKSTNFYNEAFVITIVLGFSLFLLFV
ncbi:GldL-related protein [Perlabentimonas gracilis]|jgi:drug/metabolite transporter (DMT)-like permease|uniref:GldL-related protein n=1 Tax=Perlabentimonas gracilis TaxID=2715279 RepID=UPI00140C7FBC|nr:hypothetical protein [Perlabentimonas gracilis]NHB68650.1 hypothetical protein [Perlabentimonas gracilis]